MVEQDSVKLLRECDAGTKMGMSSIGDVLPYVKSEGLKALLRRSLREHELLSEELEGLLARYRDEGKDPNVVAKGMSMIKTNVKLAMDTSDATIADLMTDGCDMGIKSLARYLNQYKAANESAKAITRRLIAAEEALGRDLRGYL